MQPYARAAGLMSEAVEADPDDVREPFQIRALSRRHRRRATEAARKLGLNVGEWMERAIDKQADLDAGHAVLPPQPLQAARTPMQPIQAPDAASLAYLVQAAAQAAQASGKPMSKKRADKVYRLLDRQVTAALGEPEAHLGRRGSDGRFIAS